MVLITATAQAQLEALEDHYARLGCELATLRMLEALAMARIRIEEQLGPFYPAPRPYPHLTREDWSWLKEGRYWIAFVQALEGHAITSVFYETANIPSRL